MFRVKPILQLQMKPVFGFHVEQTKKTYLKNVSRET